VTQMVEYCVTHLVENERGISSEPLVAVPTGKVSNPFTSHCLIIRSQ